MHVNMQAVFENDTKSTAYHLDLDNTEWWFVTVYVAYSTMRKGAWDRVYKMPFNKYEEALERYFYLIKENPWFEE